MASDGSQVAAPKVAGTVRLAALAPGRLPESVGTGRRPLLARSGTSPAIIEHPSHATPLSPSGQQRRSSVQTSYVPLVPLSFDELGRMTWLALGFRFGVVLLYFAAGIWIGHLQGWSVPGSLYFTVATLTTVGYGDLNFATASENTQLCAAFFVLAGCFVFGAALAVIFQAAFDREKAAIESVVTQGEEQTIEQVLSNGTAGSRPAAVGLEALFDSARRRLRINLLVCAAAFAAVLVVGAAIVGALERWNWRTAFYWSCVTFTSVGYGDVVPNHPASRVASIILMLVGVFVVASCAGFLGSYASCARELRVREKVITQFGNELTGDELETLSRGVEVRKLGLCSSHEHISRAEFCLYMLVKLGRVDEEELTACQGAFDRLDATHTGMLDRMDVEVVEHQHRKAASHRDLSSTSIETQ